VSFFAILSQFGTPKILVEVGNNISKDPMLLSALFEAMNSFSREVADSPLQIMQTKGFKVQFKQMEDNYFLIVGSDITVSGLQNMMNQIYRIITDGLNYGADTTLIEETIRNLLIDYDKNMTKEKDKEINIDPRTIHAFSNINNDYIQIIYWGILTNTHFKYPKTDSHEVNEYITIIGDFLNLIFCSPLDQSCTHFITLNSSKEKFETNYTQVKDLIRKTDILDNLIKLTKKQKLNELKISIQSLVDTISAFTNVVSAYNGNEIERQKIDQLRYLNGIELEHYMMIRLKRISPHIYEQLKQNTTNLEWVNQW